jgi:hypothetical protein
MPYDTGEAIGGRKAATFVSVGIKVPAKSAHSRAPPPSGQRRS